MNDAKEKEFRSVIRFEVLIGSLSFAKGIYIELRQV